MSEIEIFNVNDVKKITKMFRGLTVRVCGDCDGFFVDHGFIKYDEIVEAAEFLRSLKNDDGDGASDAENAIQEDCKQNFGSKFGKDWLKVGELVQVITERSLIWGKVNHIDNRDLLIVMDEAMSTPEPLHVLNKLGNMQVGGEHYQQAIQPVEYIHANGLPFIEGNVVKYISRHKRKGGAQDVEKAMSYCAMLLKMEYGYTDEQISKLYGK